jgi:hypothetical protein
MIYILSREIENPITRITRAKIISRQTPRKLLPVEKNFLIIIKRKDTVPLNQRQVKKKSIFHFLNVFGKSVADARLG